MKPISHRTQPTRCPEATSSGAPGISTEVGAITSLGFGLLGSEAAHAPFDATMVEHSANIVEHLTDANAVLDKLSAGSLNVGNDQMQTLDRAWCSQSHTRGRR